MGLPHFVTSDFARNDGTYLHLIRVCTFVKKRARAGERGKPEGAYIDVSD